MTAVARGMAQIRRDGMAAVDLRQWGKAIVLLREYLRLRPADSSAWTRLAESCERGGDRAGALDALRVAGEAWEREGLLPQAIAHWSKVARLSPNDGWADMKRGALCVALGRRVDAATHYRDAARSYSVSGRLLEAAQAQKRSIDLTSDADPAATPHEVLPSDETEAFITDRMEIVAIMRRYGLLSVALRTLDELLVRFPDHLVVRQSHDGLLRDMGRAGPGDGSPG